MEKVMSGGGQGCFGDVARAILTIASVILAWSPASAWAETSTATTAVSANVPARASLALTRDSNSVTRFSASQLVFDRYDDQDGQTDGNSGFMYAPYRSETGKNWHVTDMIANGSTMTLSATATGTVGPTPLADVLKLWCGGFFAAGAITPLDGTESTAWEKADGFTRTVNQTFTGTAPFNYQLNVSGVTSGTYSGSVTFTLTSS